MKSTEELVRLQAAAERAQAGYQHEEAIALYTKALDIAPPGDDPAPLTTRYELLFGRGQCYDWIGKNQLAMADFEGAARLAESLPPDSGSLALQAGALNRLAGDSLLQIGVAPAEKLAKHAVKLARQAGEPRMKAQNLRLIGGIQRAKGAFTQAEDLTRQSIALFRQAGDKAGEARALNDLAFIGGSRETSQVHIDLARSSLAIKRRICMTLRFSSWPGSPKMPASCPYRRARAALPRK